MSNERQGALRLHHALPTSGPRALEERRACGRGGGAVISPRRRLSHRHERVGCHQA